MVVIVLGPGPVQPFSPQVRPYRSLDVVTEVLDILAPKELLR